MANIGYPQPVYLCTAVTTTGLQPAILDTSAYMSAGLPPVLQIVITGAATVQVLASAAIQPTTPPTLVSPLDASNGGFSVSDCFDLIPGLLYQITIPANSGSVTAFVGVNPQRPGVNGTPALVQQTTNATLGM